MTVIAVANRFVAPELSTSKTAVSFDDELNVVVASEPIWLPPEDASNILTAVDEVKFVPKTVMVESLSLFRNPETAVIFGAGAIVDQAPLYC